MMRPLRIPVGSGGGVFALGGGGPSGCGRLGSGRDCDHAKGAMRLHPATSSSRSRNGLAESGSPGMASLMTERELEPPFAPTRRSIPGWSGVTSTEVITRPSPIPATIVASSSTSGSPTSGVNRSRARPRSCNSVPKPCGHTMLMWAVRRTDPGRRAGVPSTESSGGSGHPPGCSPPS